MVHPELLSTFKELPPNKKLYFASDFHLGAPDEASSLVREKKIIQWMDQVAADAAAIFLVGDIFDFWFEYTSTIPKGFIRFQGKLAELRDQGIPIIIFAGNHDLWLSDYFPKTLGIPVYHNPLQIAVNDQLLYVGHGDGLGPGDRKYKFFKRIFTNPLCQWVFQWIHPNIGVWIAQKWSAKSRTFEVQEELSENEALHHFCKGVEEHLHHDLYIFGHRHLPLELNVSDNSTYFNLGEWVNHKTYLEFDGSNAHLRTFEG